MKAFLMFRDQDFGPHCPLPLQAKALVQDLELKTLFDAMAQGDNFVFDIARTSILSGTEDIDTILYRQDILKDCLKYPSVIREIYQLPIEAKTNKQKGWLGIYGHYPTAILSGSHEFIKMLFELLKRLRGIADDNAALFESEGFKRFFAMIQQELDDNYFAIAENHLKELKFREGVMISVDLGQGNEGTNYILRKPLSTKWWKEIFIRENEAYSIYIADRDDAGARALGELKDTGVDLVANALAQSADHIDNFFKMLQIELGFYIGCINLHEQLAQMGCATCLPLPAPTNERRHSFHGLYDICLALTKKQKIVGNEVNADQKDLVMITGANQGGKSTFLRSIGLAQLMMQSGMFTPADDFTANLCTGVFTHYKREEDKTMTSGKLDEELSRMDDIADTISSNSLILFNESFAATNEREGSEISRQITSALLEQDVKVFFVTHQYDLAHSFFDRGLENAIFLRAERKEDGERTYKLIEAKPLPTSFGEDVYHIVFQDDQ
ncbi:DNA mismatch repair protein MutS [Ornatilinea apprima]|uniref:DNA mismatch repair protein MutS n=1 Tax=Ornatilinea apprima TaxID=1134406 RepID=A0A0P6XBV3_9CHLR|nr:DNA mismatch repair protein MutS [Ornatilinea apprima]KPL77264.1 DNA mismatch repair protein MutS [Ornatilinea apprima]